MVTAEQAAALLLLQNPLVGVALLTVLEQAAEAALLLRNGAAPGLALSRGNRGALGLG